MSFCHCMYSYSPSATTPQDTDAESHTPPQPRVSRWTVPVPTMESGYYRSRRFATRDHSRKCQETLAHCGFIAIAHTRTIRSRTNPHVTLRSPVKSRADAKRDARDPQQASRHISASACTHVALTSAGLPCTHSTPAVHQPYLCQSSSSLSSLPSSSYHHHHHLPKRT